MRILAIESELTTLLGGSERSYFDVLTGLQAKGHQVTLLYNRPGNLLEDYQKSGVRLMQSDHSLLIRSNKLKALRNLHTTAKKVKALGPFDVVYLNFAEALPLSWMIKLVNKIPVVCHIRIPYFGLSRQILWAGRVASAFIVINKKLKPVFEDAFKALGKVSVIYNGLTIPQQLPVSKRKFQQDTLRILYLGRVAPDKGVAELIHALSKAIRKGVKARLQITGAYVASHSGDYKVELQQAIDASGIGDIITISPPVTGPVDYISQFDLFVFPSIWDEPFGRTIGEAVLGGTPVLARNVGMVEEIMIDNPDFIFDTDDALTDKIERYFRGELIFDIDAARERIAREFNKTRMIDEVEKKLTEVLK